MDWFRFAMPNGRAKGMPDSDFDSKQLKKGTDVEFEHTNDPEIAKEIAKDHLAETGHYYILLEIMEKFAEDIDSLSNKEKDKRVKALRQEAVKLSK